MLTNAFNLSNEWNISDWNISKPWNNTGIMKSLNMFLFIRLFISIYR